jgi:hypothetical protein
LQNQLDCIKSLAEETEVPIVLIGTYELIPLLKLSAQLIGRSLDIHFPRYRSSEKELSQFQNVLRTFQDALPFTKETNILLKHWEFCYQRSIGCVGNLRLMLVRAVRAALWTEAKALTWKHIKTYAFTEAECYEMMLEAYDGEQKLASQPGQRAKFLKMLGLPSKSELQETPQPSPTPTEGTISKSITPQDEQFKEGSNEAGQESSTAPVIAGTTSQLTILPDNQPSSSSNGASQELSAEVVSPAETSEELKPDSDGQLDESTDDSTQELSKETSPKEVSLKPLKLPRAETPRPFRRNSKRDRTGGSSREKKDKG